MINRAPLAGIPGTLCGPALISQIVVDKYCDHLPHYRQSQRFLRQHGIELQRSTINQWTAKLADLLQPVNEAIKANVLDPHLDLDTNKLENKIRPLKLGLENYLFLGSAEAEKAAALIDTLIENCKVHGIDPERYLVEVIEALRDPAAHERAAELTPSAIAQARESARREQTA